MIQLVILNLGVFPMTLCLHSELHQQQLEFKENVGALFVTNAS